MRYFLIVIFGLVLQIAFSQNAKSGIFAPQEDIFLHTDRDLYITGEKIWFKGYCLENQKLMSDFSKVLYLELFDDEKNVLIQNKFEISNGTTNGAIEIPIDMNTGNYFLRAYTKYQRNFPVEHHYTQVVSIINPIGDERKIKITEIESENNNVLDFNDIDPILVEINTNKTEYKQRELINISFKVPNGTYPNMSISIRQKGSGHDLNSLMEYRNKNPWLKHSSLFESYQFDSIKKNLKKQLVLKNINQLKWVPEIRSTSLSGIIRNKNTKAPITDVSCLTSVIHEFPQIHLFETEKDGSFNFSYHNLVKDEKIFIGIFQNKHKKDLEILVHNDFNPEFPVSNKLPLNFNKELNNRFERIYINYQLNKTFKFDYVKQIENIPHKVFPSFNIGKPDMVIDTKEYIDLPYLEDTFREIIPGVFIYNSNGKKGLSIYSKRDELLYKNPLVLLDNVPVTDIEKLLLVEPSNVNTIEIYKSRYFLGNHFMNGIISIKTNTNNFASYKWTDNSVFVPFKSISKPEVFEYPDYSKVSSSTKPDFRTTLYWNPKLSNGKMKNIFFYSADNTGIFEIIVKGFTRDGKPCFGKTEITVSK